MTKIKIVSLTDNRIAVVTPYNADFVRKARLQAGRWGSYRDDKGNGSPAWIFPVEQIEAVRQLLRDVYGEDDQDQDSGKKVRLRVQYDRSIDTGGRGDVVVAGRQVARAFGRDSGAKIGEDIVVIKGGFGSGGSIKNWAIHVKTDTVFDLLRIPEPMARRMVAEAGEFCSIVSDDGSTAKQMEDNVIKLRE